MCHKLISTDKKQIPAVNLLDRPPYRNDESEQIVRPAQTFKHQPSSGCSLFVNVPPHDVDCNTWIKVMGNGVWLLPEAQSHQNVTTTTAAALPPK